MSLYNSLSPVGDTGMKKEPAKRGFTTVITVEGPAQAELPGADLPVYMMPGTKAGLLQSCGGPLSPYSLLSRGVTPESEINPIAADGGVCDAWTAASALRIGRAYVLMGAACLVAPGDYIEDAIDVSIARHAWDETGLYGGQCQVTPIQANGTTWWGIVQAAPAPSPLTTLPGRFFALSVRISVNALNFQMYRATFRFGNGAEPDGNGNTLKAALPENYYVEGEQVVRGSSSLGTGALQADILSQTVELLFPMFVPRYQRVAPMIVPATFSPTAMVVTGAPSWAGLNGKIGTNFIVEGLPADASVVFRVASFNSDLASTFGNIISGLAPRRLGPANLPSMRMGR